MKKYIRPALLQKYPKDAKTVFKGVIFDVIQWQQELFDGTFRTFEMVKRPDTVVVIPVTKSGKILLINQQQPGKKVQIDFPGGKVEQGESVTETAKRELFEETGYIAEDYEIIASIQPVAKIDWFVFIVVARNCEPTQSSTPDGGEKITERLVSFNKLIDLAATGKITEQTEFMTIALQAKLSPLKMARLRKQILGK